MSDQEMIVISALRYALPRRSYIMGATEDYIEAMLKKKVSQNFVTVAIMDIEEHYDWNRRNEVKDTLQHNWIPLLEKLKKLQR